MIGKCNECVAYVQTNSETYQELIFGLILVILQMHNPRILQPLTTRLIYYNFHERRKITDMTRPRVFVLLVSIPLLLLITAQWMFKINRAYLPKGESPIDFKSFRSTSLNLLELRTIEDWKIENYMVFDGFWLPQEKELVTLALLGAIDMLQTTKSALSGFTASSDLSFQRYFRTGDLATVQSILDRLLIGKHKSHR